MLIHRSRLHLNRIEIKGQVFNSNQLSFWKIRALVFMSHRLIWWASDSQSWDHNHPFWCATKAPIVDSSKNNKWEIDNHLKLKTYRLSLIARTYLFSTRAKTLLKSLKVKTINLNNEAIRISVLNAIPVQI